MKRVFLSVLFSLAIASPHGFAEDAFITIDEIPGESTDPNRVGWIDITEFSFGGQRETSTPGSTTSGRADWMAVKVTKKVDKATPKLFLALAQGRIIGKATIEVAQDFGAEKIVFFTIHLENCVVGKVTTEFVPPVADGGGTLVEHVELYFDRISFTYKELDPETGKVKSQVISHWDRVANTGG